MEIDNKVNQLWKPYQGTDRGNEPGGRVHYTADDDRGTIPSTSLLEEEPPSTFSSYGRYMKSTKEAFELKKLVQGFVVGAHLTKDVEPERLQELRNTASSPELSQQQQHTFIEVPGTTTQTHEHLLSLCFKLYNQ
jgi:hypothetical protein